MFHRHVISADQVLQANCIHLIKYTLTDSFRTLQLNSQNRFNKKSNAVFQDFFQASGNSTTKTWKYWYMQFLLYPPVVLNTDITTNACD